MTGQEREELIQPQLREIAIGLGYAIGDVVDEGFEAGYRAALAARWKAGYGAALAAREDTERPDGMVNVFIDGESYRVRPDVGGEFLLSLRPLRRPLKDWTVWQENPPPAEDTEVGWARPLSLTGGERFYTAPRYITASAAREEPQEPRAEEKHGWSAYRDRIAREQGTEVRRIGDDSGGTVHTLFVSPEEDSSNA